MFVKAKDWAMCTKKRDFLVRSENAVNFVRLMGEFGLKFRVSDIEDYVSEWDNDKTRIRSFTVYGNKRQMAKLDYVLHILALVNYNLF